jgi:hypothetical protein
MLRAAMLVALLGGCAAMSPKENPRWPDHRKHHDQQLDELQATVTTQAAHLRELEARLAKLEALRPSEPAATPSQ